MDELAAVEPPQPALAPVSNAPGEAARFGLRLAGVPVVLPLGETLEYLPAVGLFPLPLAPRRVLGLTQLRGHPVAVFSIREPGSGVDLPARPSVLVFGEPACATALVVDEPPRTVAIASEAGESDSARRLDADAALGLTPFDARQAARLAPFAAALGEPLRDREGRLWWPLEPSRLFESLLGAGAQAGQPGSDTSAAVGAAR